MAAGIASQNRQSENYHDIYHISAYHDYIPMGEINQLDNSVDHGIAESHQRIYAAQPQSVNYVLYKIHRRTFQLPVQFAINNPKRG